MPGLLTATGVLGFLADEEPDLKIFALQTLNDDIDTVWTEVAGALSEMQEISFPAFSSCWLSTNRLCKQ
jgi:26S proteasome regulatory subunit N2